MGNPLNLTSLAWQPQRLGQQLLRLTQQQLWRQQQVWRQQQAMVRARLRHAVGIAAGTILAAGAIAAAGSDTKAAGPDFEAARPDFEAAGPDFWPIWAQGGPQNLAYQDNSSRQQQKKETNRLQLSLEIFQLT